MRRQFLHCHTQQRMKGVQSCLSRPEVVVAGVLRIEKQSRDKPREFREWSSSSSRYMLHSATGLDHDHGVVPAAVPAGAVAAVTPQALLPDLITVGRSESRIPLRLDCSRQPAAPDNFSGKYRRRATGDSRRRGQQRGAPGSQSTDL